MTAAAVLLLVLHIFSGVRVPAAAPVSAAGPAVPTGLKVTGVTGTSITLAWDRSGDGASYILQKSATDGVTNTLLQNSVVTHTFTGLLPGTVYSFQICASLAGVNSEYSSPVTAATSALPAPGKPEGFIASSITSDTVTLSWKRASDGSLYNVTCLAEGGAVLSSMTGIPNETTTVRFDSLEPQTAYLFRLTTSLNNQTSAVSEVRAVTAAPTSAPAATEPPAGLKVTETTATSARLAWMAADGAQGYRVERGERQDGEFTLVGVTQELSFRDLTLAADTAYWYRVSAYAGSLSSAPSEPLQVVTPGLAAPAAPSGLKAVTDEDGAVRLSWKAATDAGEYLVFRSSSESGPWTEIGRCAANRYRDDTAPGDTALWYSVGAANAEGESDRSEPVRALDAEEANAYELFITARVSGGDITLSWEPFGNAVLFYIFRADTEGGEYALIGETGGLSWTDPGRKPGTDAFYLVSACDGAGTEVAASSVRKVSVDPEKPTLRLSFEFSGGEVTLRWNAMEGAVRYRVERAKGKKGVWQELAVLSGTTWSASGLSPSTLYRYRVIAETSSGTLTSGEVSFRTPMSPAGILLFAALGGCGAGCGAYFAVRVLRKRKAAAGTGLQPSKGRWQMAGKRRGLWPPGRARRREKGARPDAKETETV